MGVAAVSTRDAAKRFALVWTSAYLASLAAVVVFLLIEFGWSGFWHRLINPAIDHDAYDFLAATLAGALGVFLALFFSSVLALVALGRSEHAPRLVLNVLGGWSVFLPFAYFCSHSNCCSPPRGFPRVAAGLIVLVVAGVPVLLSMTVMAKDALTILEHEYEAQVAAQPIAAAATE